MTEISLEMAADKVTVVVRFDQSSPDEVHYFCLDQEGAGGNIIIKNYSDFDKPNQRTDLLLTFSYGEPCKLIKFSYRKSCGRPRDLFSAKNRNGWVKLSPPGIEIRIAWGKT